MSFPPGCNGDCRDSGGKVCPHPAECYEDDDVPWPFSGRWHAIDVALVILLCMVIADMLQRAYG